MKLTKTTALKASLLLVLAAQISWERVDFSSTELAATGTPNETVSGAATPGRTRGGAQPELSKSGAGATVNLDKKAAPVEPVKVAAAETQAAAPVTAPVTAAVAAKVAPGEYLDTDPLLVCGEKYNVRFQQNDYTTTTKTMASASRDSKPDDAYDLPLRTDLLASVANKESAREGLKHFIKEQRKIKGLACAGETETKAVAGKKAELTEEEKTKIADVKNCKTDKHGSELKGSEAIDCLTRELAHADKRVEKKDSEGKRLSEKELSRKVLSEIQSLSRNLKGKLRTALMSKDESRVEEAQEQLTAAMDAVVAGGEAFGGDEVKGFDNSISKIVKEFSALRKLSEAREEAKELKERGDDVKKEMRDSYQNALRNPLDRQAMEAYRTAQNDYVRLNSDATNNFQNTDLQDLLQYKRSGALASNDFNDFLKPWTDFQKLMKEALSNPTVSATTNFSGKITESSLGTEVAANLAASRAALAQRANSQVGAVPTAATGSMMLQPPVTSTVWGH